MNNNNEIEEIILEPITIEELTNGKLVDGNWIGDGVFDKMIMAVNQNIISQFEKKRISSNDFAQVYLGALQYTLTEGVKFLLTKEGAEQDALLKNKQSEKTDMEIQLLIEEINLKRMQLKLMIEDINLRRKQIEQTEEQTNNLRKDLEVKDKQIEHTTEQINNLRKDLEVKDKQIANLEKDLETKDASIGMVKEQTATEDLNQKMSLMNAQLGHMVDLFKNRRQDSVPEIIANQKEVEELYNAAFKVAIDDGDDSTTEPESSIIPGGSNREIYGGETNP